MSSKKLRKEHKRLTDTATDTARQFWLAGLGAYSRVSSNAVDLFGDLVDEGQSFEVRARRVAEEKADQVKDTVEDAAADASRRWGKVEKSLQTRVTRVLNRFGMPTLDDVRDLSKRVRELNRNVKSLAAEQSQQGHRSRVARAA